MKNIDWKEIDESAFDRLPAGAYVASIVEVKDVPEREYLNVVYDIAEGEYEGFYSDEFGRNNEWAHRFVRSYKESARGMFKAFLMRLEESNPGFTVAGWQEGCDERRLVGLEVGILLQTELYTNSRGEDRERLACVGVCASQDIRNGDYRLPEPKDRREKPASPSFYDEIPF